MAATPGGLVAAGFDAEGRADVAQTTATGALGASLGAGGIVLLTGTVAHTRIVQVLGRADGGVVLIGSVTRAIVLGAAQLRSIGQSPPRRG